MAFDSLMDYQGNAGLGAAALIGQGAEFGSQAIDFSRINNFYDNLAKYNKDRWERQNLIADQISQLAANDKYYDLNGLLQKDQSQVLKAMEEYNSYMAENPEAYRPSTKNLKQYQEGRRLRKAYDDAYSIASKRSAIVESIKTQKKASKYDFERNQYDTSIQNIENDWNAKIEIPELTTDMTGYDGLLNPVSSLLDVVINNPNNKQVVTENIPAFQTAIAAFGKARNENERIRAASEALTSQYNRVAEAGVAAVQAKLATNPNMTEQERNDTFYAGIRATYGADVANTHKALVNNANAKIDAYNMKIQQQTGYKDGDTTTTVEQISGAKTMERVNPLDAFDENETFILLSMSKVNPYANKTEFKQTNEALNKEDNALKAAQFEEQKRQNRINNAQENQRIAIARKAARNGGSGGDGNSTDNPNDNTYNNVSGNLLDAYAANGKPYKFNKNKKNTVRINAGDIDEVLNLTNVKVGFDISNVEIEKSATGIPTQMVIYGKKEGQVKRITREQIRRAQEEGARKGETINYSIR